jgi:hypothetical protein
MTPDEIDQAHRDELQRLFDRAMQAGPAMAALDRLIYCALGDRLTRHDRQTSMAVFADEGTVEAAIRELEQLTDEQRADLAQQVIPMWNEALSRAVLHMWHACRKLGYDPDGLGGDHLALVASVFLGDTTE